MNPELAAALQRLREAVKSPSDWRARDLVRERWPNLYSAVIDVVVLSEEETP
jgi:hypothetical protein